MAADMMSEQKRRLARIFSDLNAASAGLIVLKHDLIAEYERGDAKWMKSKEGKDHFAVIGAISDAEQASNAALEKIEPLLTDRARGEAPA